MKQCFRHVPTGRWLQTYIADSAQATPASAYLPELASRYRVPIRELEIVDVGERLPDDLETNAVPEYVPPPRDPVVVPETAEAADEFSKVAARSLDALEATLASLLRRVSAQAARIEALEAQAAK